MPRRRAPSCRDHGRDGPAAPPLLRQGPTEAKTYAINDTILCILKGGFTTVEKTLVADGKVDEVERIRRSFQKTMKGRFVEVIESMLERKVIGYMSQINADPDVAIELFMLEPQPELDDRAMQPTRPRF